jgi:hypothetical protein
VRDFATKYNVSSEDLKNLSVASILMDLKSKTADNEESNLFTNLMNLAKGLGLSDKKLG